MEVKSSIQLNSGYSMPVIGLGTWTCFNNPEGEMHRVVLEAVRVGYRHIDTATVYGTEPLIGGALTDLFSQGIIKREDMFITCKVWNTAHEPAETKKSVVQSLKDLNINYIDMVLIHWPMAYQAGDSLFPKDVNDKLIYADIDYLDTWRALEELVDAGQIRSIGLSNFNLEQMARVWVNARIQPSNVQVEVSAYHTNDGVVEWCRGKGIVVSCFAPFGAPARFWKQEGEPDLMEEEIVKQIAAETGKTAGQVLLRFLLQKGLVVLPKTVTFSRLAENYNVMDFALSEDQMGKLKTLNRNLRVYAETMAADSPLYPYKEELNK